MSVSSSQIPEAYTDMFPQTKVVIGAIWPSFYTLKNTLPENAGIE